MAEMKRPLIAGTTVGKIESVKVKDCYEASGTIRARTTSVIAGRVMGTVMSVNVRTGDRVKAGQLLAVIDDRDAVQKVRAAEQAFEAAKQNREMADLTYRRSKKLHDERALSKQEIDQIETQKKVSNANYEQAKAGLEEARIWHGFTRINAPVAGVVTDKRIDPGSMAVPGVPLFTVESEEGFQLEVAADESLSGKLKAGMQAPITIDAQNLKTNGKIVEVSPAVDPSTRTFIVKFVLSDRGLKSGLFARACLPRGEREAILVPKEALVEKGQLTGVYAVDSQGIVTYRLVRTGRSYENNIEVLSGLDAGESILTAGLEKAVDGGRIAEGTAR